MVLAASNKNANLFPSARREKVNVFLADKPFVREVETNKRGAEHPHLFCL